VLRAHPRPQAPSPSGTTSGLVSGASKTGTFSLQATGAHAQPVLKPVLTADLLLTGWRREAAGRGYGTHARAVPQPPARLQAALPATSTATRTAASALSCLSLVHSEQSPAHLFAIQGLNGTLRVSARHFHETKTTWASRFTVADQRDRLDRAMLLEQLANLSLVCREREVAYIDLRHDDSISLLKKPRVRTRMRIGHSEA